MIGIAWQGGRGAITASLGKSLAALVSLVMVRSLRETSKRVRGTTRASSLLLEGRKSKNMGSSCAAGELLGICCGFSKGLTTMSSGGVDTVELTFEKVVLVDNASGDSLRNVVKSESESKNTSISTPVLRSHNSFSEDCLCRLRLRELAERGRSACLMILE